MSPVLNKFIPLILLAGALIIYIVGLKSDPSSDNDQPPRHFRDVPPLYDPTCAICLERHDVVMLPCEHSFNSVCIREWFEIAIRNERRLVCPTCRCVIPRHMENEYRQRLSIL